MIASPLETLENLGFVVKWFRRHLLVTLEKFIKIAYFPDGINTFKMIILNVPIWNDTITKDYLF